MEWKEDEHPRDNKGQFAEKNGSNVISIRKSNKLYNKDRVVMLPKQEYAELCSAIRTKFGNSIPKSGYMLYNNYFYCYNYDSEEESIAFNVKIEIDGNEERIRIWEDENVKRNR